MDFDLSIFDTIHTHSNIFGGEDVFENNNMIGHTEPNIFGGEDFHSVDNSIFATSQPNIFGGVDITTNSVSNPFTMGIPDFVF